MEWYVLFPPLKPVLDRTEHDICYIRIDIEVTGISSNAAAMVSGFNRNQIEIRIVGVT
jgi:hypothetical protein